jgi:two-component system response regulator ResD
MGMGRVLVVEDDAEIREVMRRYLEDHGYEVAVAMDGQQALDRVQNGVELIILDLQLPRVDGFEVLSRLRQTSAIPVLIVSARGDGADRIAGLELGADDYMIKPFLPRELVARVKALLRRSRLPSTTSVNAGPVVVDAVARRVTLDGEEVELTPREYDLLKVLAQSPGRTFSREELLDRVWGAEYIGDTRRVDIHISKLRSKLTREARPSPIRSVWGVGYRYEG